jgi:hypothetical protein
MNISDDAVVAALDAHLKFKNVRSPGNANNAMRAALEAAAPHLHASALEDAAAAIERDEDPKDALAIEWLRARASALKDDRG